MVAADNSIPVARRPVDDDGRGKCADDSLADVAEDSAGATEPHSAALAQPCVVLDGYTKLFLGVAGACCALVVLAIITLAVVFVDMNNLLAELIAQSAEVNEKGASPGDIVAETPNKLP